MMILFLFYFTIASNNLLNKIKLNNYIKFENLNVKNKFINLEICQGELDKSTLTLSNIIVSFNILSSVLISTKFNLIAYRDNHNAYHLTCPSVYFANNNDSNNLFLNNISCYYIDDQFKMNIKNFYFNYFKYKIYTNNVVKFCNNSFAICDLKIEYSDFDCTIDSANINAQSKYTIENLNAHFKQYSINLFAQKIQGDQEHAIIKNLVKITVLNKNIELICYDSCFDFSSSILRANNIEVFKNSEKFGNIDNIKINLNNLEDLELTGLKICLN